MKVSKARRDCPICTGKAGAQAFPYRTKFSGRSYEYVGCLDCGCTFVDPLPDEATFRDMYAKHDYHDRHYVETEGANYLKSAKILATYLTRGASVLDYGCGTGEFLKALLTEGLNPTGVEFDADAAQAAASRQGVPVFPVAEYEKHVRHGQFDALHFGDVLEHLPAPAEVLRSMLPCLRPGGLLFAEGPLENNPSPVFLAAKTFGMLKQGLGRPAGVGPPTHLMRVSARQQAQFFERFHNALELVHWDVEETGWPYANGGPIKKSIATLAKVLGGRTMAGVTFGNRFRAVYRVNLTCS